MTTEEKARIDSFATKYFIGQEVQAQKAYVDGWNACKEWQDTQFKEYLEKRKAYYKSRKTTMRFGVEVIDIIINELFEK